MATPRTRLEVGLYVSVLFPSGLPQLVVSRIVV